MNKYADPDLHNELEMYGVIHFVWVDTENRPMVCMANDDDGYYVQYMLSRKEVDFLIEELEKARDKCWPMDKGDTNA